MTFNPEDTGSQNGLPPLALTSTIDLLERFKQGDEQAVSLLVERSLPPLKRWARDSPKPRTWFRMRSFPELGGRRMRAHPSDLVANVVRDRLAATAMPTWGRHPSSKPLVTRRSRNTRPLSRHCGLPIGKPRVSGDRPSEWLVGFSWGFAW